MSVQRWDVDRYGDSLEHDDTGRYVLFTDHERAVAEAVKKALDSARARLLTVPSIRCHPDNPNIEMVEQEEAYCAVLDVLPIGIPGYSHPKDAIKAAVDEAVAAERAEWIEHCNRVELREREACAQAVEALLSQREGVEAGYRQVIAAAIRSRGQA